MISIHFKLLTENDLPLLHSWFQKLHVKKWYARGESYTLDMIKAKYLPRILHPELIPNFIIYFDGKPIGYIQLYCLTLSLPDGVQNYAHPLFENCEPKHMAGLDLFIAEEEYLYRGHGALILKKFIPAYVKGKFALLIVDPLKINKHAIHFFKYNGFKKLTTTQPNSPNEVLVLSVT